MRDDELVTLDECRRSSSTPILPVQRRYTVLIRTCLRDRRVPRAADLDARNPTEIAVRHTERVRGTSAYSLRRLLHLQLDLLAGFSMVVLRLLFVLGIGRAAAGVGFGLFLLATRDVFGSEWAIGGLIALLFVQSTWVGSSSTCASDQPI
jgi:hypothetical protein